MKLANASLFLALVTVGSTATAAPHTHKRTARAERPLPADIARDIDGREPAERERACREATGYTGGAFLECSAEVVGRGTVAVVRIVTACGPDGCETAGWVIAEHGRTARVPGDAAGAIEALPGLEVVVKDQAQKDARGEWGVGLVRVDPRAMRTTPFAACMSPVLSPGRRWFVCRDRRGAVLRVPSRGGPLEEIAAPLPREHVDFCPEAKVYPEPVVFAGERTVTYERRDDRAQAVETVQIPWQE